MWFAFSWFVDRPFGDQPFVRQSLNHQSIRNRAASLVALLFLSSINVACAAAPSEAVNKVTFKQANIQVAGKNLHVEYADSAALRARGLMFRKSLCEDCGMLFKFAPPRQVAMWMKNTFVPLDVAYFTKDGTITDIKPLQPHNLTPVGSSKAISYALEMNQGWFAKHKVSVGDKIKIVATSN